MRDLFSVQRGGVRLQQSCRERGFSNGNLMRRHSLVRPVPEGSVVGMAVVLREKVGDELCGFKCSLCLMLGCARQRAQADMAILYRVNSALQLISSQNSYWRSICKEGTAAVQFIFPNSILHCH